MTLEDIEVLESAMKDRMPEFRDQLGTRRKILLQLEVLDLVGSGQLSTQAFSLYCCILRHVKEDSLTARVRRKTLTKEMHFMRSRALEIHLDALVQTGLLKIRETRYGGVPGFEYTLGLIPHPGRWD
ncbi:hypothetical protein [Rhodococcus sp. MS16]|uniref:hypothetical protein n=1 Tax=Rhodococcus sp. MS16 TaxID=2579941 RepID=UPI00156211AA|nr:hypothetical protein [Rhodococcus sp. MS16]